MKYALLALTFALSAASPPVCAGIAPNAIHLHFAPAAALAERPSDDLRQHQPHSPAARDMYNCCGFFGITGPNNLLGTHMLFDAMGIMPTSNLKVTEIDVAISYNSGVNQFSLALYNDKGGVPGTALKVWSFTNLPPQGSCCQLTIATDPVGIPVTAGQRYWVVVRTDHNSLNYDHRLEQKRTQYHDPLSVRAILLERRGGSPACSTPNDALEPRRFVAPALAFAVLEPRL